MDTVIEKWYYIKDGLLWMHSENDGAAYLRKRFTEDKPLCRVEDAEAKYAVELNKARNESPPAVA